jgi:PPE-repeat protein
MTGMAMEAKILNRSRKKSNVYIRFENPRSNTKIPPRLLNNKNSLREITSANLPQNTEVKATKAGKLSISNI